MKTIKSKVILNILSTVLPLSIGLYSVPILIKNMGVERYGLLALALLLIGNFSFFDMGLARSLTQKVAQKLGKNEIQEIKGLIFSVLSIILFLGILCAITIAGLAEYLVYEVFNITEKYLDETIKGFYWVAIGAPLALLHAALIGVLEGQQHFGWTAIIKIPFGLLSQMIPLIVLLWTPQLDVILSSLLVLRLFAFFVLLCIVLYTLKDLSRSAVHWLEIRSMFKYGGWITISNIVSQIMVFLDRFYITSVLSASIIAYYTTPLDILLKILFIPGALVGVMFAVFSNDWSHNQKEVIKNYKKSIFVVFIFMAPFSMIVYFFAKYGLTIWLGENFAEQSYQVAQIIVVGIFINAIAYVPVTLIQGVGRADISAKIHLIELPFFLFLLWYFVEHFGLVGAAYAWTIRVTVDAILLFWMSSKIIKSVSIEAR